MKLGKAVISIVVSAALISGAGYGAYYVMQGQKSPVEVVPVSNVNAGAYMWEESTTIYGTVTSQVAQTVSLNEEYKLDQVYVKEGDTVKEGDRLFSYDMTLQELELEMEKLTLQTKELTMTKLEKDLEKLKKTTATASLESRDSVLTASAEEDLLIEEIPGGDGESGTGSVQETGVEETQPAAEPGTQENSTTQEDAGTGTLDGLQIEGMEEVASAPADETGQEQTAIVDCALSYERLVGAIDALFQAYGDDLKAAEVGSAIHEAVLYYRRNLADEIITQGQDSAGNPVEKREYKMKDSVREALGEENAKSLETYSQKLDGYQTRYVEMLIDEAVSMQSGDLSEAVSEIRTEYGLLSTQQQSEVENLSEFNELEKSAEQQASQPGSGTEKESESGTEAQSGQESESETEAQSGSEAEKYKVTVTRAGGPTEEWEYLPGDTVRLTAEDEATQKFEKWEVSPQTVELRYSGPDQYTVEFTMPGENVTIEKIYMALPDVIQGYVDSFLSLAAVLDEGADSQDYVTRLGTAVDFYQQWLAEPSEEFVDQTTTMEQYQLKKEIQDYMTSQNRTDDLSGTYKKLCMTYAKALFKSLNPDALDRETLEKASAVYDLLGAGWQNELEQSWQSEQAENGDKSDGSAQIATIADTLKVYVVFLMFQEYQRLDPDVPEDVRQEALQNIQKAYLELSDEQKLLLSRNQALVDTLKEHGLWIEPETEPESDFGDFPDDGFGDLGDGTGYTASELKEMIEDKEREIKDCSLTIRESELAVKQKQRIVDGKTVKSTLNGTVISIGSEDGTTDNDYFVKVANEAGLYAKGSMNELALEKINVGDTISGVMTDSSGVSFTAVIKEISTYPDPSGSSMSFGSENTNASYYPFYALIENTDGIEEGEAEMQLSATAASDTDAIYLEKYFVRTENDGRSYVFKQGEDGKLMKQYVTTGKTLYSYAIEIVSGLELTDKIAFPYGKSVVEGAQTKEVDMLQDAYM